MNNLTNSNYKGNLVQVIDIDIKGMIDLEEGVFITLKIIQKKSQKKTYENSWVKLWSEIINKIIQTSSMNRPKEYFYWSEWIVFSESITNNFSKSQTEYDKYDQLQ